MTSFSNVPLSYDLAFIMQKAGVTQYGYEDHEDHRAVVCNDGDFEAVQAAIASYPVDYANEVLKARMWDEVKFLRTQKEALPAPTPVGPVDTDDRSKIKVLGLVQMAILALQAQQPFEAEFTLADNTVVMLTATSAIAMGQASGLYVSKVYARARALRAQINAAADINELDLIDITTGWPA